MNKVTQSIYKNAVDKAFFDNKGNLLVNKGTGTTNEGVTLQIEFSKWYLMGDNLSLEVAGYYTSNISANSVLVSFELPEYISSRITTAPSGSICLIFQIHAANVSKPTTTMVYVQKLNNAVRFINTEPINITGPVQFRIRCDILLN